MHLKVFLKLKKSILETEKTLKTPSSGQIYFKKPKKNKKPKKPTGLGFFKKPGFFPTLFFSLDICT
jgi:hypothetical protein